MTLLNAKECTLDGYRTDQIPDIVRRSSFSASEIAVVSRTSETAEPRSRRIVFHCMIHGALDLETVCLKWEETLALHKGFSTRAGENASMISQRVDHVRRKAVSARLYTSLYLKYNRANEGATDCPLHVHL